MIGRMIPDDDLLVPPEMVHLQTGGVGAMPRPVFEATVAAMSMVESDPVSETYGPGIGRRVHVHVEGREEVRLATGTGPPSDALPMPRSCSMPTNDVAGSVTACETSGPGRDRTSGTLHSGPYRAMTN